MSEDLYYRRRVSRQQLEVLAQYMERYPPLALATARSREGHIQSKRMWDKIARTLNRIDQSQPKSGIGWSRYWADLKFKIRRKYAVIQKCHGDGTPCRVQLTPLEDRIVKILTDEDGNLLPAGSVYQQMLHYPVKENTISRRKSLSDTDAKLDDDITGLNDTMDDTQDDYIIPNATNRLPEHILLPDSSDTKPNVTSLKNDIDPILIVQDDKKSIEELKRELVEFELRRQKELFEIEKQQKIEKHEIEMSILRVKKQLLMKDLKKL